MLVESFSATLGDDFEIAGCAFDGRGLLALVACCPADCLLLDLWLPGANGLELIPQARLLQPVMKILVVTMMNDRLLAEAALDAGAHGFVPKDAGIAELVAAISEVLAGRRYVSPKVPKTSHRIGLAAAHAGLSSLTPREHEIVMLLGEGKSETEIARTLGLGLTAITFHKKNLMPKLGISDDARLTRLAVLLRPATLQGADSA